MCHSVLQRELPVCFSVLEHIAAFVAVCCIVLQCFFQVRFLDVVLSVVLCVVACCTVCCRVLQSVLQSFTEALEVMCVT